MPDVRRARHDHIPADVHTERRRAGDVRGHAEGEADRHGLVASSHTKGANDLYALVRGTCALSSFFPVDSYDYTGFGTRVTRTASTLGAKTIALSFADALKTPSYPFPTTGSNKATATVVLARKS